MINIDSFFGISETDKKENKTWDKDFVTHLYTWLNGDTKEKLFGLEITKDFENKLETIIKDVKSTTTLKSKNKETIIPIFLEEEFDSEVLPQIFDTRSKKIPTYFYNKNLQNNFQIFYKSFSDSSKNFYNFTASGTA